MNMGLQHCVARHRAILDRATRPVRLADGSTIGVARFGRGPMVVCVPTIAELNFVYAPQIEALSDRFEVVVFQPRLSRTRRVSLRDRVRELNLVLDALNASHALNADNASGADEALDAGRVHLLSWSDAGSVAYRAAVTRPDRFGSAVFMGLPDQYRFPGPLSWMADALYRHRVDATVPSVAVAALLSHFLGGRRVTPSWVFGQARRIPDLTALFSHSILPCMLEHDSGLGRLAVPSLMLAGTRDALVGVDQMRAMAAVLGPQCETVVIPKGEHILSYANPDAVNRALSRFYQQRAPSRYPMTESNDGQHSARGEASAARR